jgi:hypothetical protein
MKSQSDRSVWWKTATYLIMYHAQTAQKVNASELLGSLSPNLTSSCLEVPILNLLSVRSGYGFWQPEICV